MRGLAIGIDGVGDAVGAGAFAGAPPRLEAWTVFSSSVGSGANPTVHSSLRTTSDTSSVVSVSNHRSYDVPSAYPQGIQKESEQVVARPPPGFRKHNEEGVEILWLMMSPLYGQADAGAIWNRTFNDFCTKGDSDRIVRQLLRDAFGGVEHG